MSWPWTTTATTSSTATTRKGSCTCGNGLATSPSSSTTGAYRPSGGSASRTPTTSSPSSSSPPTSPPPPNATGPHRPGGGRPLGALPPGSRPPTVGGLEDAPEVLTDPPLLERVVAGLVANASRFAPPEHPVLITASALAGRVELRIVDAGPGLALSRGLTEAMGGTLTPEDTPGGGLTMVLSPPCATPETSDGDRAAYGMCQDGRSAR
ncbi:sensor histidine kinase [Streptomyces sp. NPDC057027]|uniref:sensor histidine kinase n=1 Tax=Streptomyces sp. NPDC057027 TaxID=3346004 RepID=UPI00362CB95D